jgi:hypothetical protein
MAIPGSLSLLAQKHGSKVSVSASHLFVAVGATDVRMGFEGLDGPGCAIGYCVSG